MTVSLSKESQKKFFEVLFGQKWASNNLDALLQSGLEISVNWQDITAKANGFTEILQLSMSTTALMKGTVAPEIVTVAKAQIAAFISKINHDLFKAIFKTPATKSGLDLELEGLKQKMAVPNWLSVKDENGEVIGIQPLSTFGAGGGGGTDANVALPSGGSGGPMSGMGSGTGFVHSTLKEILDQKKAGYVQEFLQSHTHTLPDDAALDKSDAPLPKKSAAKKKVSICKLRDAQVIGQKVYGTSQGSIYTMIAANSRVKIACRLQNDQVSVRAEFNKPTQEELSALASIGLQNHGEYYSFHMATEGVSPARILGAFLLDCGIEFDDQIKSGKELLQ